MQLLFDPRETSYAALCEVFRGRIDPTLRNQVGLDRGASYRHALYAHGAEQLAQATASLLTLTLTLALTLTLTLAQATASLEARRLALAPATVWRHARDAALPRHSLRARAALGAWLRARRAPRMRLSHRSDPSSQTPAARPQLPSSQAPVAAP